MAMVPAHEKKRFIGAPYHTTEAFCVTALNEASDG